MMRSYPFRVLHYIFIIIIIIVIIINNNNILSHVVLLYSASVGEILHYKIMNKEHKTSLSSLSSSLVLDNNITIQFIPTQDDRVKFESNIDNNNTLCEGVTLEIASMIPPRAILYNEMGNIIKQNIPRIIWQTYKTTRMPHRMAQNALNWAGLNPEYTYRFYDDNSVKEYLLRSSSNLPVTIDDITSALKHLHVLFKNGIGVAIADIWRLAILYEYGGVYADIDAVINNPLRQWIYPNATIVTSIESSTYIAQYVMMFRPRHIVTKNALQAAIKNIINNTPSPLAKFPNTLEAYTGPPVVREAFNKWLTNNNKKVKSDGKPIIIGEDIVQIFHDVDFSGNIKFKNGKYHSDLKKCHQSHWLYGWYKKNI